MEKRLADSCSVTVVGTSDGQNIANLPTENVFEIGFSPRGSFIITWQRPSKDERGDAVKNLLVRKVINEAEGDDEVVGRFVQKSQTGWNLQYTFDEQYCARVVTNEIQFYESQDLGTVWNKLRVEGVTDFAVSPGHNYPVAVFVPERKVSCASLHLLRILLIGSYRVLPPPSRSSTFHTSEALCLRRISSKVIRSS